MKCGLRDYARGWRPRPWSMEHPHGLRGAALRDYHPPAHTPSPGTARAQMVNEAEFAAMKAAKKAAKAAKATGTAGEAKKQQRSEERKKRKVGGESSAAAAPSRTATVPTGDGGAPADDSSSAAYAVVNAAAASGPLHDKTVSCIDCGTDFVFSVLEHAQSAHLAAPPARLMCLHWARLVALGSSALPGRGRPTGRPATSSGAAASKAADVTAFGNPGRGAGVLPIAGLHEWQVALQGVHTGQEGSLRRGDRRRQPPPREEGRARADVCSACWLGVGSGLANLTPNPGPNPDPNPYPNPSPNPSQACAPPAAPPTLSPTL